MAPRNVVLIGFMGAGKSAVGHALAERMGAKLFDTDAMIEKETGSTIDDLFRSRGEEEMRSIEHEMILRACAGTGRVIATGGGAVLQIRNYGILKGAGTVVYLRAPADVLRARVGAGSGRPLLSQRGAFDRLLAERMPAYESAADLIVDTDAGEPDEIAARIVEILP
jgi:shikimate kinase